MKTTSENRPETVTVSLNRCHQQSHTINFDIAEDPQTGMFTFETVDIGPGGWDRASVIDAIIRSRYSQRDVEAIIANFLAAPEDELRIAELRELQEWRSHAKLISSMYSYE